MYLILFSTCVVSCIWSLTSEVIATQQQPRPTKGKESAPAPNLWPGETHCKNAKKLHQKTLCTQALPLHRSLLVLFSLLLPLPRAALDVFLSFLTLSLSLCCSAFRNQETILWCLLCQIVDVCVCVSLFVMQISFVT